MQASSPSINVSAIIPKSYLGMSMISIFEIFKIGIGPSSSHTVGPMRAAKDFVNFLRLNHLLLKTDHIITDLYGSLALTAKGHGSDKAVIMGLAGEQPDTIDTATVEKRVQDIVEKKSLPLTPDFAIDFDYEQHLKLHNHEVLPKHVNGMRFTAYDATQQILHTQIYYSVGGGFIVKDEEFDHVPPDQKQVPFLFETAAELLAHCRENNLTIPQLMMENEKTWHQPADIRTGILHIVQVMEESIDRGCHTTGFLPGGLNVPRRASRLYQKLNEKEQDKHEPLEIMYWLNVYALAVNEENAAGGRVVTAPTNGAAGIIPAVLHYYKTFYKSANEQGVIDFLLTAAAIAILYKLRASISGAEVGCQGEVGVACSMAAGALAAAMGGTLAQIENAAEIGMEHNLGLPCDPVMGLVQIPCIERNAMGAVKAVNAAQLALAETGEHKVSLDAVIATMNQIGKDMSSIYKETSLGGLAVNITEC